MVEVWLDPNEERLVMSLSREEVRALQGQLAGMTLGQLDRARVGALRLELRKWMAEDGELALASE